MQAGKLQSLRHSPYPALLWDETRRRVIWANAAAVAWFGAHGLAELVERPFDVREPGVQTLARAAEALRAGTNDATQPQSLLAELHFPSTGQDTALKVHISPCALADGRKALLVIARQGADVAARPRVLSEILGEMPQPVLALAADGEPLFANAAALELLGEQGMLGEDAPFADELALRAFLLRAREAGTAVETREIRTRAGLRALRLTARAAAQDDLVVVMIDDITDRLRAERGELPQLCDMPDIAHRAGDIPQPEGDASADQPAQPTALRADELATLRRMMQALQEEDDTRIAPQTGDIPPSAPSAPRQAEREPLATPTRSAAQPRSDTPRDDARDDARDDVPQAETPEAEAPKRSRISIRVRKTATPLEETDHSPASPSVVRAAQEEGQGPQPQPGQPDADQPAIDDPPAASVDARGTKVIGTSTETAAGISPDSAPGSSSGTANGAACGTTVPTGASAGSMQDASTQGVSGNMSAAAVPKATASQSPEKPAREIPPESAPAARSLQSRGGQDEAGAISSGTQAEKVEGDTPRQAAPVRQRPEPPQLVRDVLDHRPEPIILHRSDSFYFANHAARELLGHATDAPAWDDIARALAAARDGAEVRLPEATGALLRFTLKRDVFPWRAGVVVQSTLRPLGRVEDDGSAGPAEAAAPAPAGGEAVAGGHATAADEEAATAASGPSISIPASGRAREASAPRPASRRAPAPVIRIHTEHGGRAASDDGTPRASLTAAALASEASDTSPAAVTASASTAPASGGEEREQPMDEELRAMLETAADGIITLNANGEILSFSSGAERLFGQPAAAVLGRPFRDLLVEESRPALDVRLARLRQDPAAARRRDEGREVQGLTASGKAIPLFLTIGVLQHTQPRDIEHRATFCAVVHDISAFKQRERELKQAKEQAEQRSARKSEFLARISHELRTPLNAILGFSDVLRQELFGQLGNEKYRDYARDIYDSGEHLLSLVNDLLDLARIEAGRYELDLKEVDLARIVEETVNIMREQAASAGITLRRVVPDDLPPVVADARSIKQILLNLLSNTVKYARNGDSITITMRQRSDGGLELSVKDTGPGMSAEELQDALEPFRRVPRTGEDKPGTGLGLPLAKALAEANRARFEIASEPGKGTEARIIFPPHRVLA